MAKMKTRSKPSAPVSTAMPALTRPPLVEDKTPPTMVFLPKHDIANSCILELEHPRTGELNKFFYEPTVGLYEFKRISTSPGSQRSVLTVYDEVSRSESDPDTTAKEGTSQATPGNGYVNKTAFSLVATPIDPVWIALPLLSPANSNPKAESKRLFQPLDDVVETVPESAVDLRYLLGQKAFLRLLEERLDAICETVDAGGEKMFRVSEDKLARRLVAIAENLAKHSLPASMEEHFVRRSLEAPVLAIKREESSISTSQGADVAQPESLLLDSQSSDSSSTTISTIASETSALTPASSVTEPPGSTVSTDIVHLQRIRTALSFVLASYIPSHVSISINTLLSSAKSPIDFAPLDEHLIGLAALRAEAQASRSIGDFSRKRTFEDDEGAESRSEKKQRLEEEEKRKKAGESRGVRDLKKVDTKGMKKMSQFFTKVTPKPS